MTIYYNDAHQCLHTKNQRVSDVVSKDRSHVQKKTLNVIINICLGKFLDCNRKQLREQANVPEHIILAMR